MKTIEEGAKEYLKNTVGTISKHASECVIIDFKKGVEFAQQWISTKDEMPENSDVLLVKYKIANGEEVVGLASYFDLPIVGGWTIKGSCPRDITHWRPIERI